VCVACVSFALPGLVISSYILIRETNQKALRYPLVGDQFLERRDQDAMLHILQKTEDDHARPTEAVRHQMMRSWGWISEE
jgi:hypothetical protein